MAEDPFPRERVMVTLRRLPAYVRLAWHLAREPLLSKARRAAVIGAAGYLVSPVDLVPGIVPVLGQLDDIAVAIAALRFALAGLSPEQRRRHLEAVGLEDSLLAEDLRSIAAATAWTVRAGARTTGRAARRTGTAAIASARAAARTGRSAANAAGPKARSAAAAAGPAARSAANAAGPAAFGSATPTARRVAAAFAAAAGPAAKGVADRTAPAARRVAAASAPGMKLVIRRIPRRGQAVPQSDQGDQGDQLVVEQEGDAPIDPTP